MLLVRQSLDYDHVKLFLPNVPGAFVGVFGPFWHEIMRYHGKLVFFRVTKDAPSYRWKEDMPQFVDYCYIIKAGLGLHFLFNLEPKPHCALNAPCYAS